MPLRGFFVTGTDTGIGKTLVAASLCRLLRDRGIDAVPVKPVQTGVREAEPGDLDFCLEACGLAPSPHERKLMNPFRFDLPASPHLAAEREGRQVDTGRIVSCCNELMETRDCLVVEGAGGLLVPLTREVLTVDLARGMGLPLVVLARAGLGTINHTLLTLRAAREAGLEVAAVVLNHPEPEPQTDEGKLIEADNARIIGEMGGIPVVISGGYAPAGASPAEQAGNFIESLDSQQVGSLLSLARVIRQ